MTRPDDLDHAEARVAAARARLSQSTEALQSQLQPRVVAQSLIDEASAHKRPLIVAAVGLAGVTGAVALAARLLKRRRAKREADPAAYARRINPSAPKPESGPRVRFRRKRKNP